MEISDVLIHIDESISNERRFKLEETLRDVQGIVSPRFSKQEHLMFVTYDSDSTSASTILTQIRDQGYASQIVGI